MISLLLLLIGLVIGAGVIYFYFNYKLNKLELNPVEFKRENKILTSESLINEFESQSDHSETDQVEVQEKILFDDAIPIKTANEYFKNYLVNPVLKTFAKDSFSRTDVEADIKLFTIPKSWIESVAKKDSKFNGIALIPGLIPKGVRCNGKDIQSGHTLIMVGYTVLPSGEIDLILPPNERSVGYIHDHINICPDMCPKNYHRLLENPTGGRKPWTR